MTNKLADMLAAPTAPPLAPKPGKGPSASIEIKKDTAEVSLPVIEGEDRDEAVANYLRQQGLRPEEWRATGFRSSEWTLPNGELGESLRWNFVRVGSAADHARPPIDELIEDMATRPNYALDYREQGEYGFIVGLGDTQFGKVDGDGVEGTLSRLVEGLERARDLLPFYRRRYDIGHIHNAWLGDHVEGFVSQGGANVARTNLTLNEQIRLTRRAMQYSVDMFAPEAESLSFVAVPGNHGEPQRFMGSGITRYDDSHDTEALVAVADACALYPEKYGHINFFVPDNDELTVTVDVAGTRIAHAHGHSHRPGKHFEWWEKQAFGGSPLRDAHLLIEGHLHHFHSDTNGGRMFIGAPALEYESTWWRHRTGTPGRPGIFVAITKDGVTSPIELIDL